MEMRPFGRLLSLAGARRRVINAVRPVRRVERIPIETALGRVASSSVSSPVPVPSFRRATWDGYALLSRATRAATRQRPVEFRIVGEVYAEQAFPRRLRPNETVAIATGSALPTGTDAVLIFERARVNGPRLLCSEPLGAGDRVAEPGEDFRRGTRLVSAGEVLAPASLGALAAAGVTHVRCFARPRVAIIPNGNELVSPGDHLKPGQIHESNNVTLSGIVDACGGVTTRFRPVRDDPGAIERAGRRALSEHDFVIFTGGSSVGERDFLPAVFPRLGRLLFHGISVRPGKPTLAAVTRERKVVLGMPGHPTSCLSNGLWLLLPTLRKLAHLAGPGWVDEVTRLAQPLDSAGGGFSTIVPLHVADGWGHPTFRDSSAITSLTGANGFTILPPPARHLSRGERLPYHHLLPPLAALSHPPNSI